MIGRLLVLGAGDVTTRYVFPALAQLAEADELPDDLTVDVAGRGDHDTAWLRDRAADALADVDVGGDAVRQVADALSYHRADATDAASLAPIAAGDDPVAVYLALPTTVFADAIAALAGADLATGSRIVLEKPFGTDAESAAALNDLLHERFDESDVFRVDHFLGKQTTQNICAVRFANRLLEPVWSHHHVERVEVVWDETLALEGRAGYYDGTGAARDMLQNHLLQLLCLVAMEPPESLDRDHLADRKVDVLRSLRPWGDDPARSSVRARYTAGEIDGEPVPAYVDEDDVDADNDTETFAEITMAVDTPRWKEVPFTLRSGKALAADRHHIAIHFGACEHVEFAPTAADDHNVLRLSVGPDEVAVRLRLSSGGELADVEGAELVHELPPATLGPYALLLRQVLAGDIDYSVRDDEAVAAWHAVEPFLTAWSAGDVPMDEYAAGSDGPGSPTR